MLRHDGESDAAIGASSANRGTEGGPSRCGGESDVLSANTTYLLKCSGAGGTSLVAAALVAVSTPAASMTPRIATLTSSQTQLFMATLPSGRAALWSVDGIAGGRGRGYHLPT